MNRLRALADDGKLLYPIVAVNDAETKWDFDNIYGTGQSSSGRHPPRHQRADRGEELRGRGLRPLRPGRGHAGQGYGCQRHRDRGQAHRGA